MNKEQWNMEKIKQPDKKWDVFISHASEDKEEFVRPLAEGLRNYGVKVWYDEFELRMGDSLIESIDKGLQNSKFGIIVISPAFFEKNWTDYEFKNLMIRQINVERVILPIWYKVSQAYIQEKCPYLLDIKALSSEFLENELIEEILRVVRPDILNSHLMLNLGKKIWKESKKISKTEIPIEQICDSPIRHKSMPKYLVIATRLISEVFRDVLSVEYEEMVINFARDLDYDREFIIWSAMANAYTEYIRETKCDYSDIEKKRKVISLLLRYTYTGELEDEKNLTDIGMEEYIYLITLFINNYNHIISMVEESN